MARPGTDTRDALLDAAERLVAERGVNGVSLREVGQVAGARNNSAAQYHFGNRDGLLHAVVARRSEAVDERRERLVATLLPGLADTLDRAERSGARADRADLPEVAALVRCLVEPLAAEVDGRGWYLRFLDRVMTELSDETIIAVVGYQPTSIELVGRALRTYLRSHTSAAVANYRLGAVNRIAIRQLAEQQARLLAGDRAVSTAQVLADTVSMLTALVEAD